MKKVPSPYTITPIDQYYNRDDQMFPEENFICLMSASVGHGKTTTLIHALTHFPTIRRCYDSVTYISPSFYSDSKLKLLQNISFRRLDNHPMTTSSSGRVRGALENIITTKEKAFAYIDKVRTERLSNDPTHQNSVGTTPCLRDENGVPRDRLLIIIDDALGWNLLNSDAFENLALCHRHINVSLWINVQKMSKYVRPVLRQNASIIILAEPSGNSEVKFIQDEWLGYLSKEEYIEVQRKVWGSGKKYQYLVIHKLNSQPFRLSLNFDTWLTYE